MKSIVLMLVFSLFAVLQAAAAALTASQSNAGPFWVLPGPGVDRAKMLALSNGYEVGVHRPTLGLLIHGQDQNLRDRLRANGALLVLPHTLLFQFGCSAK